MADPLSIASGIVGIVVPALQGLRLLLDDLDKIREAPRAIEELKDNIQLMDSALAGLQNIEEWEALGDQVTERAKTAILICNKACKLFRANLQRWTRHSADGRLSRLDQTKIGLFKQDQIKSMSEQLQNCKSTITLAVEFAILYCSKHHMHISEEIKKALSSKEIEIQNALQTTDLQIVDVKKRLQELEQHLNTVGRIQQSPWIVENAAIARSQIEEENKALHASKELLNALLLKVQGDAVVNMAARDNNNLVQVTFGSNDSGLQIGVNNGAISGITFGAK